MKKKKKKSSFFRTLPFCFLVKLFSTHITKVNMSTTSPMMDLSGSIPATTATIVDENFQSCDSPSGSSTSEPHDEAVHLQQPSFIDQSFFYKLDQLSPDNPLFFMQQQHNNNNNNNNGLGQLQNNSIHHLQQQQQQSISPSMSPPASIHSPSQSSLTQSNFADPLLPNSSNANDSSPTFWSGFNNVSNQSLF